MSAQGKKQTGQKGGENLPEGSREKYGEAEKFWHEQDMQVRASLAEGVGRIKTTFEKMEDKIPTHERAKYSEGIDRMLNEAESALVIRQAHAREVFDTHRAAYMEQLASVLQSGQSNFDEKALQKDIEKRGQEALRALKEDQKAYMRALERFVESIVKDKTVSMDELITFSYVARNLSNTVEGIVQGEYKELVGKLAGKEKLTTQNYIEIIQAFNKKGGGSQGMLDATLSVSADRAIQGLFLNALTPEQKKKLIDVWIDNYAQTGGNVGEFVEAMIVTGVLRNDESSKELFRRAAQKGAIPQQALSQYFAKFKDGTYFKKREAFLKKAEEIKEKLLTPKDYHSAAGFLSLENLIWSRVGDLGGTIALANIVFSVGDPESMMSNPYIPMGLGALALSVEKTFGDPYGHSMTSGIGRGPITEFITGPSDSEVAQRENLESAEHLDRLVLNNPHLSKYFGSRAGREAFATMLKIKTQKGEQITPEDLLSRAKTSEEREALEGLAKTTKKPEEILNTVAQEYAVLNLKTANGIDIFLKKLKAKGVNYALATIKPKPKPNAKA